MSKQEVLQSEINIGLIGHVDAGKTSLTKALTGKWTDTHTEELKKGISIRLGYAEAQFRKCTSCQGAEAYCLEEKCRLCRKETELLRRVSFVDAPGHETLMTTMLSGAAIMNGAILVIAANEKCPQPQTEEHLLAASILGIKNIVVVQNKIDLVSKEMALENYKEIKAFLKQYGYENSPILPIAAHFGTNIDLLIEALEKHLSSIKFDRNKPLKMFVARSFDINKPGTKPKDLKGGVFGGSITQGSVRKGDEIEVKPGLDGKPLTTKVVAINIEKKSIEEAFPGGLIGIETLLDPNITRNDQMKGQLVGALGSLPDSTIELKLEINPIKRIIDNKIINIAMNDIVVLTIGTMSALGNVRKKVKKGVYELQLKNPVVIEKNQKVAINKWDGSRWRLVAYGIAQ